MTDNTSGKDSNNTGSFVGAVFRFLFRLAFVILLGIVVGAITYFVGLPALTLPQSRIVENNTSRLDDLESFQSIANEQVSERLTALQDRLVNLEVFRDSNQEFLNGFQGQIDDLATAQAGQDEAEIEQSTEIQIQLDEIRDDLDILDSAINEFEMRVGDLEERDLARGTEVAGAISNQNANIGIIATNANVARLSVQNLKREITILKAMELITRSRLFLSQNNFGLAAQDIQAARDILADLRQQVPAAQADTLTEMISRLSAALSNLPGDPSLAEDDLELAWQLLVRGIESETSPIETPTPVSTPGLTPTPSP